MSLRGRLLLTWLAVAAGNFLYQAFDHDWAVATERSFFQGAALLAAYLVLTANLHRKPGE